MAKQENAGHLKCSVLDEDLQVRILPPLPPHYQRGRTTRSGFDYLGEHQYRAYAYLLGLYLGDGHLVRTPRTYRLQISLNARDAAMIGECVRTIIIVAPHRRVGIVRHGLRCVAVSSYAGLWPQSGLVRSVPSAFLRGLVHSDGCRHRRVVKSKNYPAYSFKNHSSDILGLFLWACDLVGLRARRSNAVTISIARRPDVARLDALMGITAPV